MFLKHMKNVIHFIDYKVRKIVETGLRSVI